jgi:hypothetical protein
MLYTLLSGLRYTQQLPVLLCAATSAALQAPPEPQPDGGGGGAVTLMLADFVTEPPSPVHASE